MAVESHKAELRVNGEIGRRSGGGGLDRMLGRLWGCWCCVWSCGGVDAGLLVLQASTGLGQEGGEIS
jgi:hypothetical protein